MSTLTITNSFVPFTKIKSSLVNTNFTDITTWANGNITNSNINAAAAIAYSKLNLALSVVNADISTSAAIAYSKLNLATSIVNADINAAAAIAYSKLSLTTSIVNGDIAAAAAIAYSKLAALGTAKALQSNSSTGFIEVSSVTNTELGYLSGVTSALQTQLNAITVGTTSSSELFNLGLAASVGASALTVALKQADGATNPAAGSGAVKFGMRSSTVTSGAYNERSVTGALSVVVSSGSTLGHRSGKTHYIYVYAIDNAGTVELAVSSRFFPENVVVSTTAEGGAGAATDGGTMYSTTARTNVPCRLIGRLTVSEATAGTWASAPSVIEIAPIARIQDARIELTSGNAFGSSNTKVRRFTNTLVYEGSGGVYVDSAGSGGAITVKDPGLWAINYSDNVSATTSNIGLSLNSAQLTTVIQSITNANRLQMSTTATAGTGEVNWTGRLAFNDVVRAHTDGSVSTVDGDDARTKFTMVKIGD